MKIFKIGCFGLIGLVILLTILGAIFGEDNQKPKNVDHSETVNKNLVIDANKFSKISPEKLIEIMGNPEKKEHFSMNVGKKVSGEMYYYDKDKFEFLVIDNRVVRLNVHSDSWSDHKGKSFKFKDEDSLFSMFGIKPGNGIRKTVNTGSALRYTNVSNKVDDLWIVLMEGNSFEEARVIYDMEYF